MQSNSSKVKTVKTKPSKVAKEVRGKTWQRHEKESKKHQDN